MNNVFDGAPDARQSPDVLHKVSRFRPTYRALDDAEDALEYAAPELTRDRSDD